MSEAVWTPRMTVSAVIERDGKYLLVEELDDDGEHVFNQPAGHLEDKESLLQAVEREVLEETGYQFSPQSFTGLYRWQAPKAGLTFMRLNFIGNVGDEVLSHRLDADIIATHWLSREQILTLRLRSPLVLQCIDDYLKRPHYSLCALIDHP